MKIGSFYQLENGEVIKCVSRYLDADSGCFFVLIHTDAGEDYWVREGFINTLIDKELL